MVAWTRDGFGDDAQLGAAMESMQYHIPARDGAAHLREGYASAAATCHLFAGDFNSRIRLVNGRFRNASLVVAGGGPAATDADLIALFGELRDMARRLAPAAQAHAFLSFDPTFATAVNIDHMTDRVLHGGVSATEIRFVWDLVLIDAFPYQILCPGHLARLGRPPEVAHEIGGGLVELSIDSPESWLVDPAALTFAPGGTPIPPYPLRDPTVQRRARDLLAPCLVDRSTSTNLFRERYFVKGRQDRTTPGQ